MRMVRPQLAVPTTSVAEEQQEYKTVVAAWVTNPLYAGSPNTAVLCYRLTGEERTKILRGEDLYLHFLGGVAPHILSIGAEETAAMYGVAVER